LSLLVGAAVAGIVGALLAVPVAASVEIVLTRFQHRETPVAQDAAAIESSDAATDDTQPVRPGATEAASAT
jgi:predicted PurR-regulated permease PerM